MKKKLTILTAVVCLLAASCTTPVKLIFETDMGNDIDDAVALAMIHRYIDDGAADLLSIGINKEDARAAEFVDIMDTWYGHPDIPDAVEMYRKVLASQKDGSVSIASVGFSTNLARLLLTGADEYSPLTGSELVRAKVKELVVMAGNFTENARPEYNVLIDIPSAKVILEDWPGRVVISPFELGSGVRYPATSIENDFGQAPHPLADAYKAYDNMPYNRQMWDPTAVVYAVEGGSMFTVSEPGTVTVDESGVTHFTVSADGDRIVLSVNDAQAKALADHIVNLTVGK